MSWLRRPSKARRIIRARWARDWGQVLERVIVRRMACWRSVMMSLRALPGIVPDSEWLAREDGWSADYRGDTAILEGRFSRGVLGRGNSIGQIPRPAAGSPHRKLRPPGFFLLSFPPTGAIRIRSGPWKASKKFRFAR